MLIEHRELTCGSKKLDLDINWKEQNATIRFGGRDNLFIHRKTGETTEIFLQAEGIIQTLVGEKMTSIQLKFDTSNTNLKLWAEANKDSLGFQIDHDGILGYRITITKEYKNEESK